MEEGMVLALHEFRKCTKGRYETTPTTKIFAIGTMNFGFEQSQVFAVLLVMSTTD
jgi:hypothetical protein